MQQLRNRKYPVMYRKLEKEEDEKAISISAIAAAGILAFAFVKGMFWGYMLKKRMG